MSASRVCVDCDQFKPHAGRGLCVTCYAKRSRAKTLTEVPGVTRQPDWLICATCNAQFQTTGRPAACPACRGKKHKPAAGAVTGIHTPLTTVTDHRAAQLAMTATALRLGQVDELPDMLTMLAAS